MDEEKFETLINVSGESWDNIGKILNTPEASGLEVLAVLLAMPDEDFEIIRPLFQEELLKAYEDPQTQLSMIKAIEESGISIDDVINRSDEVIDK